MRRISNALALAVAMASVASLAVAHNPYLVRIEDSSSYTSMVVYADPIHPYSVPFSFVWWNVLGLSHGKRVPLFGVQRYRDRLSARHLSLAPALTGAGARRISGFSKAHAKAVGKAHTLTGMC